MSESDFGVPGLIYIPDYISSQEEQELLAILDEQVWSNEISRRVQQYGYRYDYRARSIMLEDYLGKLPEWTTGLSERLVAEKKFSQTPDQLIVNEYLPGQGIGPHIDCTICFGPVVASLSLISSALMVFVHATTKTKLELLLEPRSLLLLTGEARYDWKHGIAARTIDTLNNLTIERQRRISLTLRTVQK